MKLNSATKVLLLLLVSETYKTLSLEQFLSFLSHSRSPSTCFIYFNLKLYPHFTEEMGVIEITGVLQLILLL